MNDYDIELWENWGITLSTPGVENNIKCHEIHFNAKYDKKQIEEFRFGSEGWHNKTKEITTSNDFLNSLASLKNKFINKNGFKNIFDPYIEFETLEGEIFCNEYASFSYEEDIPTISFCGELTR